ncbi:MAG: EthD family reductase [Sphingobium sp.]|uniref:Ethyl tert-butyl ether degradation protein EthD n=1 Tax=Sphingobium cupriresistens LL01 TaxID=1420583 RepID=A0A0J8AD10_9SPHN|nr:MULTISPECIES: EthD family reductase [Sphingobium]KMS52985.1 ethyl tert-butyl ether degradation protein EthD [Sphingobium cupriresistens LL01]MBJ7375894.1 EthD family reductase [Sphingobium sp.]MBJ7445456.1 EthD family reductase [Sphingobium sp.]
MHHIVALYGAPQDPDHFRTYYLNTHLPLAAKLPAMVDMHYSFAVDTIGPGDIYFCTWTGIFADAATARSAMQSIEGQALAADVPHYASGGITLLSYTAQAFAA